MRKNGEKDFYANRIHMHCRIRGSRTLFFKPLDAVGQPLSVFELWITGGARNRAFKSKAGAA
jgi:hypothetical protein